MPVRRLPRHPTPPQPDTLKVALLAAAAANPGVEKRLLGTKPAPGAIPSPRLSNESRAERALRAQSIAYELKANNGRYSSRSNGVALKKQREMRAHPLVWAVIPTGEEGDARFYSALGDAEGERLREQLFRTVSLPGRPEPLEVMLLPLQWEEAKTLAASHPELILVEDGQVYRSASPRSLFVGPKQGQQPTIVQGIESYGLKMHLSADSYARLGGLGGSREINHNDALFAAVLSQTFREATADLPLIEVQSEGRALAATIGKGSDAVQVGAIFRELPREAAVPGFAFFSPTLERLPHDREPDVVRLRAEPAPKPRILAADAIRIAMQKNEGMTKEEAFLRLFVDPLLDVNFQLAPRGWSMELHPQNFQLKLDPKTGLTSKVVIRDLHGLNYSAAVRAEHGLPDQMSVESLRKSFPDITQADVEGYFHRDGALRDRYKPPGMFQSSLDFFTSIFWYHLLDGVHRAGLFHKPEVTALVELIKDRLHDKAEEHGFDLGQLRQPRGARHDYWVADKEGIRGRVLFRRPV